MLVSPEFASWVVQGINPKGGPADPRPEPERFAEHERQVMDQTNGFRAAGGKLNVPWPRSLGTPPWGAQKELENGAARPGAAYAMRVVRLASAATLHRAYQDLVSREREGLPALLYIGSARLPRHVTLVLPTGRSAETDSSAGGPEGRDPLDVYDPAAGSVTGLPVDRFAGRTLGIAGWDVPWIIVQPRSG